MNEKVYIVFVSLGWRVRVDLGSRSSWEREINECVDALLFY